jgi:hypothetical protein
MSFAETIEKSKIDAPVLKQIATYGPKVIQILGPMAGLLSFGATSTVRYGVRRGFEKVLDIQADRMTRGAPNKRMTFVYDPVGLAKETGIAVTKSVGISAEYVYKSIAGYLAGIGLDANEFMIFFYYKTGQISASEAARLKDTITKVEKRV